MEFLRAVGTAMMDARRKTLIAVFRSSSVKVPK